MRVNASQLSSLHRHHRILFVDRLAAISEGVMKTTGAAGKLTGKPHLCSSEGGSLTGEIIQRDGTQAKPGTTHTRWMESVDEELCSRSTRCKKDKCRNANGLDNTLGFE